MSIYHGDAGDIKRPVWRILRPGAITPRVFSNGAGSPTFSLEDFQRLRELARETVNPAEPESPGGQGSLR